MLFGSFSSFSLSWNQAIPVDEVRNLVNEPYLINDRLVLKKVWRNMVALESYNSLTNESETLIEFAEDQRIDNIIKFNDMLYFLLKVNPLASEHRLWKTDGTASGTVQVNDLNFYGSVTQEALQEHNNTLFAQTDNGGIIEIYDNSFTVHEVHSNWSDFSKMCVFGANDFILQDFYNNTIFRVTNGTKVDLTDKFPTAYVVLNMEVINNQCYVQFADGIDWNAPTDVLRISTDGESQLFSESQSLAGVYQIFEFNNQTYVFRKNMDQPISSSLIKLNSDGSLSEEMLTLENGTYDEIIKTKNHLLVSFKPNNYFEDTHHFLINENLDYQLTRSGIYLELPDYRPTLEIDYVIYPTYNSSNQIDILELSNSAELNIFKSKGFNYRFSVSSEFSNVIYFGLTDVVTNLFNVFILNDAPKIGISINGIWHDPELKNQGLFIRQGIRNNNSTYIFTSLYTFRDGKPLWLAGNADYNPNQNSITIDLYEYYGANFLEYFDETQQSEFGQITIEMLGCDELQATVEHNNESKVFNLSRIDNTTYNKFCLEQTIP